MPAPVVSRVPRLSLLKPSAVNSILAEVRALQAEGRKLVSLMRGEPDFATPPHIVDAAIQALRDGRTSYPDNRGELKLRAAVAAKLQREQNLSYDPATEILITDGATLGLSAALMALVGEGDAVLLPDPVYDAYQSPIRLAGATISRIESRVANDRFEITMDALESAWTPAARVILLNTPWNPVGTVLSRHEIGQIAEFAMRRNLIILSDEIYEKIVYDDAAHLSPAVLSPEVRSQTVIVNSFSKTYAMTGWRLGYAAGPAPVIQSMFLVLQQSSRGPATFVQDAGIAALEGPQQCVAEMRQVYAARRQQVVSALQGVSGVRALPPEGGFFSFVDVASLGSSDDVRQRLLQQHGVVVAHGAAYGEKGEGYLRVSFATGGANLTEGLEKLRAGLAAK